MGVYRSNKCRPENHICCGLIPLGHTHEDSSLWDKVYISYDNKAYLLFNLIISVLCLVSSYFYASLVGFRYSAGGVIDINYKTPTFVFESFFLAHMVTQFFLEYKNIGEAPVNKPFQILTNYLSTTFPLDFICILPLQFIKMKRNRQLLFFMIKMLRL